MPQSVQQNQKLDKRTLNDEEIDLDLSDGSQHHTGDRHDDHDDMTDFKAMVTGMHKSSDRCMDDRW